MSSFEKHIHSAEHHVTEGAEKFGHSAMKEISPLMGSTEGTSMIQSMRGQNTGLPNGFPSSENIFNIGGGAGGSSSNPLSQIEGMLGGGGSSSNPLSQIEGMLGGGSSGSGGGILGTVEGILGGGGSGGSGGGILGSIEGILGGGGSGGSGLGGLLGSSGGDGLTGILEDVAPLAML